MAYASFEEVVLDGPFHQIVVDRSLCDLFVVCNRLVVIGFYSSEIGNL